MYPGQHADQPAVIMAESGETITYCELEARSNRLAHLLRAVGLKRLDHYAIFMENHPRYVECCAAGERSGLYFTCINSFLTTDELTYIVNNSRSKVLITSEAKREVALAALRDCPKVELLLIVDGPGEGSRVRSLSEAAAEFPRPPQSVMKSAGKRRTCSIPRARPAVRRGCSGRCSISRPPSNVVGANRRAWLNVWRFPRRPSLPLACASLPRRAIGRGRRHDPARRNGRRHGAIHVEERFLELVGATPRHSHPACADHVFPAHAETAKTRAPGL